MSATTYPNYSPGLEGVVAGISTISEIISDTSTLVYRGYNVHDLASKGTFEETAYLLLYGKLPNRSELDAFNKTLRAERPVPKQVYDALRQLPKDTHPMDMAKVGFAVAAPYDPDYAVPATDQEANLRKAVRIVAKASTIIGNGHRIRSGKEPLEPKPNHSIAQNFLYLMSGEEPDAETAHVLDSSLTLYAEHGFNASTFACLVTVATLSDIYSGMVTGIGTLRGPLHGGANEEAMKMILEIGSPDKADAWIHQALANKRKIMGFGHREYKKRDPRAIYLTRVGKELCAKKGQEKWSQIADILENVMETEKGIYPNVDFPAAYAYYVLGFPIDLYTPIFVMARVSGWSAHVLEQLAHNRLIRPQCIYEGPHSAQWVPVDER
ncbi:MAG TPA: citrate/2-methylcitrate synthase [Fimbriimonadaceae bacterium]|nr:citrate/2-methylcitrate synthase [Fimbriimonadaceae bacterium]